MASGLFSISSVRYWLIRLTNRIAKRALTLQILAQINSLGVLEVIAKIVYY